MDESTAPSGLADATSDRWNGTLAIHEITENKEGQMELTYLSVLRDRMNRAEWTEFVKRIYSANPTTYDCMPEMALNVGMGRSQVGFPVTLSCVAYYLEVQNRPVKHRMPNDVPYMVTFAPTIAILKHREDPEWARKAFDFGLSERWQGQVESFGGKIPTRKGTASTSTVPDNASYFPTVQDAMKVQETLALVKRIKDNLN